MFEEDQKQRQYYDTVREEFARETRERRATVAEEGWGAIIRWLCRLLTYITPFGICVNYSKTDGSPYRLNVHLTPSWIPWGIDLHHFFRSDQEPEYHNHPWFVGYSRILLHGYIEHYLVSGTTQDRRTRYFTSGEWNTLWNTNKQRTWHRLELYEDMDTGVPFRPWTLFFHGRRIKDEKDGISSWGFFNADTLRYTGWRQFVNQPPSRTEAGIHVEVDPDPTPMFGTALGNTVGVPDTFDSDNSPTTPLPREILKAFSKEDHDASVRTGVPGEPESGTRSPDQEGTP